MVFTGLSHELHMLAAARENGVLKRVRGVVESLLQRVADAAARSEDAWSAVRAAVSLTIALKRATGLRRRAAMPRFIGNGARTLSVQKRAARFRASSLPVRCPLSDWPPGPSS